MAHYKILFAISIDVREFDQRDGRVDVQDGYWCIERTCSEAFHHIHASLVGFCRGLVEYDIKDTVAAEVFKSGVGSVVLSQEDRLRGYVVSCALVIEQM